MWFKLGFGPIVNFESGSVEKKGSFSFISQGNRIARFIPQGGAKSGNFFFDTIDPKTQTEINEITFSFKHPIV